MMSFKLYCFTVSLEMLSNKPVKIFARRLLRSSTRTNITLSGKKKAKLRKKLKRLQKEKAQMEGKCNTLASIPPVESNRY